MADDPKGYYRLLNLEPGSSVEEVNLAYGFLKYEWEKDGKKPDAKLQAAYECLSDPDRKVLYDTTAGDEARSARNRLAILTVIMVVLLLFGGFVFPGFFRSSPEPYRAGDRLVRQSDGAALGEIVRREEVHRFPADVVGAGYLVRKADGTQRWYPASDLELHYRRQ